jgi:hypothetical protein
MQDLRAEYVRQGSFVYVENFLPAELTARLIDGLATVRHCVNRNYLPGHKQGGSVSRHTIDHASALSSRSLYRSAGTDRRWLEAGLTGEHLQLSPADDPHAYALYFIRVPAITSAGTTTPRTTPASATPAVGLDRRLVLPLRLPAAHA